MNPDNYILPNWDAPTHIRAVTTTRRSAGQSLAPFQQANYGLNTPDKHETVLLNRELLRQDLGLEKTPMWLTQVHKADIYQAHKPTMEIEPIADASISKEPGLACAILTADCLPVLITNREGSFVAALHCGWQGLYQDLIHELLNKAPKTSEIIAWVGPGISQSHYEVDTPFFNRFQQKDAAFLSAFKKTGETYLANLPQIAEQQLKAEGIDAVYQSQLCSYTQTDDFYSYRRDGKNSGRMATLIWIEAL